MLDVCRYHIARKRIPSVNGTVPGIKLEQFIFDAFALAEAVALIEVERRAEFLPVKNADAPGAKDCPRSARNALLAMHTEWVTAAGGSITQQDDEACVEVAPALSYAGEGLEAVCSRNVFNAGTCLQ
jgi:UDP-N-acetylglucosamine/UDP-N-acetylgalactosamine diphosphorylase